MKVRIRDLFYGGLIALPIFLSFIAFFEYGLATGTIVTICMGVFIMIGLFMKQSYKNFFGDL